MRSLGLSLRGEASHAGQHIRQPTLNNVLCPSDLSCYRASCIIHVFYCVPKWESRGQDGIYLRLSHLEIILSGYYYVYST